MLEVLDGILHQRNGADLVSLAMQNNFRRGIQFQVTDADIQHFLDTSACVIKENQHHLVTQTEPCGCIRLR